MMESGLLLWGVREGHWLLPIWGGGVSKTLLAICRGVDGTQGTVRDIGIIGRTNVKHPQLHIIQLLLVLSLLLRGCHHPSNLGRCVSSVRPEQKRQRNWNWAEILR